MSDISVAEALRSNASRVVVEAPAGTGKTFQAASYARHAANDLHKGQRVLILAHTHAACGVFSSRTADLRRRLQVGTIDSLVAAVAKIYHRALDLPADVPMWSIERGTGSYPELARRVRLLLEHSPGIAGALVERHPVVICDEHQDASSDQHGIIEALARAGARTRYFGDPMQAIFAVGRERAAQQRRWRELVAASDANEALDTAHRWADGSQALGAWVLEQRERLRAGDALDLRGDMPRGLQVFRADNQSPRYGGFQLSAEARRPINAVVRNSPNLLILTPHNATVGGLNAFFGWRIPIWEGHSRDALSDLLAACRRHVGNPVELGMAMCTFLEAVGIGFSATAFGNRLVRELETRCANPSRGKPAEIQSLARLILQDSDHVGVGAAIHQVGRLMHTSQHFSQIRIDLRREFAEACQIQVHSDMTTVLAAQAHQRAARPADMPPQVISTVHKSKGLETSNAILLPCDASNLANNEKNRCLLYVALSRARESLALVVPHDNPSPLVQL